MTFNWNGRPVKSGIAKILVALSIVSTLPFHCIKWLFDGRGYCQGQQYAPGAFGTLLGLVLLITLVWWAL